MHFSNLRVTFLLLHIAAHAKLFYLTIFTEFYSDTLYCRYLQFRKPHDLN